ncbi:nucleophosmin 1b isoform X1 [Polyodon spathula]|uniref:nucleophosmin 1b isoform X1 n=1 Tax=Polyodon spathula TaxID=7913 RepID=UPI001B7F4D78|nr:nucleophosmin 1b isoform X1 [Polyodon spathula]
MAEDQGNAYGLYRPQVYLFGCELKPEKKEYKFDVVDEEAEHQLCLKSICLGAEAVDEFHTVEIEGLNYEGAMTKVQLAVLKPSVIPSISLGGFEITPPVTFRLKSGSGPVFISGQHFISAQEEEDDGEEDEEEEENNTSPVKRLSDTPSNSLPVPKKLKFDKEVEDEDEEEDDDDEDDDDDEYDDDEEEEKEKGSPPKTPQKNETPGKKKSEPKSVSKQNCAPGKTGSPAVEPQPKTPCEKKEKSGATTSLSVNEIKDKLKTMVSKGHALPKSQLKFANFAKYTFKIVDQKVAEELWNHLQKLKAEKK